MPLNKKANIQFIYPYTEWKVKYFIFAQVNTEKPTLDKKYKTIVNFQIRFYKIIYNKFLANNNAFLK